jgi:hypothetical protein
MASNQSNSMQVLKQKKNILSKEVIDFQNRMKN